VAWATGSVAAATGSGVSAAAGSGAASLGAGAGSGVALVAAAVAAAVVVLVSGAWTVGVVVAGGVGTPTWAKDAAGCQHAAAMSTAASRSGRPRVLGDRILTRTTTKLTAPLRTLDQWLGHPVFPASRETPLIGPFHPGMPACHADRATRGHIAYSPPS
jgi:hypothetical protein